MLTREQILIKMGADKADKATQDAMLQKLADTVRATTTRKMLEKLSEENLKELEPLLDAGNDVEIEKYIKSKIPDYDAWAAQIEEDVINEVENNSLAIEEQVDARLHEGVSTD